MFLGAGYLQQCCLTSSSSTLSKFVDAAKLCEVVDTLEEGRAAIQRDLQLERSNTMQRNWMGPGGQWAEQKSAMCPCWKEGQLPAAWTKTEPADKGCDFSHLCTVEGWAALDTGCSVGDSKLMWGEKGFFSQGWSNAGLGYSNCRNSVCRYLQPSSKKLWVTCINWTSSELGFGLAGLWSSIPMLVILQKEQPSSQFFTIAYE